MIHHQTDAVLPVNGIIVVGIAVRLHVDAERVGVVEHIVQPALDRLERVVGCGRSCAIDYGGTGAYFLHKSASLI